VDHVTQVLKDIAENHPKTLPEPEPFVGMSQHGDSAVVFKVRVWVNSSDYWPVYFDMMELVKKRFDAENISMPYPQLDVHIDSAGTPDPVKAE